MNKPNVYTLKGIAISATDFAMDFRVLRGATDFST